MKAKKASKKNKMLSVIVIILIAIILISFLYGLIRLIIEPSNVFVVESRKNIQ